MNADLKDSFSRIKPVCDVVMVCPSPESITNFVGRVTDLKKEVVQELQQYLLFPFITHLKSTEMEKKYELQWQLVDGMRVVLEKVTVNSYEMCMKIETSLLQLVFDNAKPGMIADVPEELKHSVIKCLTVLMLNIEKRFREKLLRTQVPLVAQAVFVAVHIAKLEKLRPLRLAAINCVMAHTVTHPQLMNDQFRIPDANLEVQVVDMLSSILPGVLAALQDVATCTNNPGHAVVVASIEAIHRILCLTMSDRYLSRKSYVTAEDFAKIIKNTPKIRVPDTKEVSCKETPKAKDMPKRSPDVPKKDATKRSPDGSSKNKQKRNAEAKDGSKRNAEMAMKDIPKRSTEWYRMAGDKLTLITKSIISLRMHEHYKVRKELAVFCSRVLTECTLSMQPSIPICLDIVISLARDEYPMVAEYASNAVNNYFCNAGDDTRHRTMDNLCENFFVMLNGLPRILNNIDTNRKISALNLLYGYLHVMCDAGRPQRLTAALSAHHYMRAACHALADAAALDTRVSRATRLAHTDVLEPPPTDSPWCKLRHLDSPLCEQTLREICAILGEAECADLVLDRLLQLFHQQRSSELVCLMNWMAAAPNSSINLVTRILDTYIEEAVWYLPLEIASGEAPLTEEHTLDATVYNPHQWTKDHVPGLYEGAVETRYTDISYAAPRAAAYKEPNRCSTLAEAQANLVQCCLLTEGVGIVASRLKEEFQRYLLNTLCLVLERVGSKYELLHLAGLKALNAIAGACGHACVAALVAHNADYFTHQVTVRLKKSWNTESALQILSVVIEYSDASVLDCLCGIVRDVLVQSCDKYYEQNLYAYLQVFHTFVECILKWFPLEDNQHNTEEIAQNLEIDLTKDLIEWIKNNEEAERLMDDEEFEKETGKSVEEMYREDLKEKEDNVLDYDDRVSEETPPLPRHISVTMTIMMRCLNFVTARRECALLAMRVLERALPLLAPHAAVLLPLVHLIWTPLVIRFRTGEPIIMRRGLALLVTMARLAEDFILGRCDKEILPHVYKYLDKSSRDSLLKDAGSAYRNSQAYSLQVAMLEALPTLAVSLRLEEDKLVSAMASVEPYLSNKQPKPLQALAVKFFKAMLAYDYGATWAHLRALGRNQQLLPAPAAPLRLQPALGSPYTATDQDYDANIKLIFDQATS